MFEGRRWGVAAVISAVATCASAQDSLDSILSSPPPAGQAPASGQAQATPAAPTGTPAQASPSSGGAQSHAPADGASTQAEVARPANKNRLVEEIVVTAQKREENIQDVPISISAFSANALDAKGIDDPRGLAQAVPGVYYGQTVNFSIIYIRGIGSDAFLPDSDPSVATYIDGIYYPFANGLAQSFGAVERVEVLKGPQGTLFGRNSTGGAFNTVTKDPGHEFETSLMASYGSFNDLKMRGYVSIPLTSNLAASLAVTHNSSHSYYSGTIDDVNTPLLGIGSGSTARPLPKDDFDGARLKVKWNILDNLDLTMAGFVSYQTGLDSSAMPNVKPSLLTQTLMTLYGVQLAQPYQVHVDVPGYFRLNNRVAYGNLTWHPDWFDVKFLGSRQKITTDNDFDFDGTQVPLINFNAPGQFANVTTGEFQLISKKGGITPDWLDGIVGLYYFDETSGFPNNKLSVLGGLSDGELLGLPIPSSISQFLSTIQKGIGLPLLPNGVDVSLHDKLATKSWAAFTQETIHFTPWLDFTAGIRYQWESRNVRQSDIYLINVDGSETKINYFPPLPTTTPSEISHNVSPKFVLGIKPMDDTLIYASYTKGYKSGTYNTVDVYTEPTYVKPEIVGSAELGLKTTLFDGALRFNAAAFENKIHDLQVQLISVIGGGVVQLQNANEAKILGAEFDTQWNPMPSSNPGLVVSGGLTYLDSKYTDFKNGSGYDVTTGIFFGSLPAGINTGRDFSGNQIARTPRLSGTAGLNQIIDVGSTGNVELAASGYYNSGFFYSAQNNPNAQQKSYFVVDASVSYLYQPWNTRLTLFAKNLNNEVYTASEFILDTGTLAYLAPPRTFGVRLNWDF